MVMHQTLRELMEIPAFDQLVDIEYGEPASLPALRLYRGDKCVLRDGVSMGGTVNTAREYAYVMSVFGEFPPGAAKEIRELADVEAKRREQGYPIK
ncbi:MULTISPECIES: hypothetical protein [unclassified Methanosarcina]|uniref:hypothetical protein n=1 Tax=unclassified Methanosarcina TaxID=2644672 RepID=UPI000615D8E5|nr:MULTISPECIES: hypothetical protein [unclassified Methanosarcina]AKB19402.1 hypothetical protein MSWHS_2539 [Methanosarcina sp. WWM596]